VCWHPFSDSILRGSYSSCLQLRKTKLNKKFLSGQVAPAGGSAKSRTTWRMLDISQSELAGSNWPLEVQLLHIKQTSKCANMMERHPSGHVATGKGKILDTDCSCGGSRRLLKNFEKVSGLCAGWNVCEHSRDNQVHKQISSSYPVQPVTPLKVVSMWSRLALGHNLIGTCGPRGGSDESGSLKSIRPGTICPLAKRISILRLRLHCTFS